MLAGSIDEGDRRRIRGWVRNPAYPDAAVSLVVTADDRLVERVVANRFRPDLERAGIGLGKFGFDLQFNPPLSPTRPWLIHIRSEFDGEDVPGSPLRLAPSKDFDGAAQIAFAAALASYGSDAELDERIAYLDAQRHRLLGKRGSAQSAAPASGQQRALVIDERTPQPDHDGGSSALMSHMRSLQRLGYAVTFAAPAMAAGPEAAALEQAGIACCTAPWFGSVEEVLRRNANGYDLVYLHRIAVASAYTALVRQTQPQARLVFSVADLHHLRVARQAQVEDRPELMAEARRLRALELFAAQSADAVITHSSAEAALLRDAVPPDRVHVVAWSVPSRARAVAFAKRTGMAFIGNYSHAPNADAARQLRDEIMPRVHAADPAVTCQLVGTDRPRSLDPPQPGLVMTGHVPDLEDLFNAVRLTVAPLQFGAGLKGKVLESLGAGVPCVCSPIAAEGVDLPARLKDLVAPDSAAFVRTVLRLHNDEAYNARMSERCLAFAGKAFSEATLDAAMGRAVGASVQRTAKAG